MDAGKVKGLGVVSIASGAKLGTIDDVLFDVRGLRLGGLMVKSGDQQAVVPLDQVKSIGGDAVTILSDTSAQWGQAGTPLSTLPRLSDMQKLKVVDEAGTLLGTVKDIEIMPDDGRIAALTVHKGGVLGIGGDTVTIRGAEITSVGDEVIVVPVREATA